MPYVDMSQHTSMVDHGESETPNWESFDTTIVLGTNKLVLDYVSASLNNKYVLCICVAKDTAKRFLIGNQRELSKKHVRGGLYMQ